jgi:hypothetical protein
MCVCVFVCVCIYICVCVFVYSYHTLSYVLSYSPILIPLHTHTVILSHIQTYTHRAGATHYTPVLSSHYLMDYNTVEAWETALCTV